MSELVGFGVRYYYAVSLVVYSRCHYKSGIRQKDLRSFPNSFVVTMHQMTLIETMWIDRARTIRQPLNRTRRVELPLSPIFYSHALSLYFIVTMNHPENPRHTYPYPHNSSTTQPETNRAEITIAVFVQNKCRARATPYSSPYPPVFPRCFPPYSPGVVPIFPAVMPVLQRYTTVVQTPTPPCLLVTSHSYDSVDENDRGVGIQEKCRSLMMSLIPLPLQYRNKKFMSQLTLTS